MKLTNEDREFFSLVTRAIFLNPFSDERAKIDARIAGVPGSATAEEAVRIPLYVPRVAERLAQLEAQGATTIAAFEGKDRKLVEYAWLFRAYHRIIDEMDEFIRAQREAGATPVRPSFAAGTLAELRKRGFSKTESVRFFELFYQLRRAFFLTTQGLIGCSPSMKTLRESIWNHIFTHDIALYDRYLWKRMEDFSTLLLGETGTGKGTAAVAIGQACWIPFNESKGIFEESFTQTFLAINLSQYPESLIESELFGHRKGAFTGAVGNYRGVFSRSSAYGALFLDEIGEVSTPIQIKLLQVLQERTFAPVGSHQSERFEGRVIAATNRPLQELRAGGAFRDDFYYRLCSDIITVPPLRQRVAEDPRELDDLIALTVERTVGEPSPELSGMVGEALARDLPPDYPWPGNVRELEQAVRRILLSGGYGGEPLATDGDFMERLMAGIDAGALEARELLAEYCAHLYRRFGTYEEVARRTGLDRRTVRKHILAAQA
jgi:two-component system, NtrC family, response regulator HydG